MAELTHNTPSINKFGLMEDYDIDDDYLDDDSRIIAPLYEHDTTLDDMENVSGFNRNGKRNGIYVFKLGNDGIYTRAELPSVFDRVQPNIRMNVVMGKRGKFRLVNSKNNWLIDIRIRNDTVVYEGDSNRVLRIHNLGSMIGNYVPIKTYAEYLCLSRYEGEYYLSAQDKQGSQTGDRAAIEFKPKFKEDTAILLDPPEGSTMYISGMLLKQKHAADVLVEGMELKISKVIKPTPFYIRIRKTKDNYSIRTFPETMVLNVSGDVNLHKLLIFKDIYMVNRINFSTENIDDKDIIP